MDVSCEVWGDDGGGNSVWYSGVITSSGNQSGAQWLAVPPVNVSGVETFAVKCFIPGPYVGNSSHLSGFSTL